jgi:hypothetical protein
VVSSVLVVKDLNIRGDLVDGQPQVVADGRGASNSATPSRGGQERRLADAVGDPVEVPLDASDVASLVVQGRAER